MFDESVFFPAFAAAGMLYRAQVPDANGGSVCVDVGYYEPDMPMLSFGNNKGTLSKEYQIEYQADDLPGLAEGDQVLLTGDRFPAGQLFVVREPSFVAATPFENNNGFFRRALLTKT